MSKYPFMQVDAFTEVAMGGNPCAILFEADDLDDETMLTIAREMNLSETSFVRKSEVAAFGARYFTPAEEIPLAGHPTVATMFALVESGRLTLDGDYTVTSLELPVGPIKIEIFAEDEQVKRVVMSQKKPQFFEAFSGSRVMPIFGLSADDLLPDTQPQIVSTGTPQLMIAVKSLEVLRRINTDFIAYNAFRAETGFFGAHLFCLEGITPQAQTFARHVAAPPDIIEDPFTGSSTGGMAAYLWHHGLIESPTFLAEQGHWMKRPGQATVEIVGPRDDIETVKVGGGAVTVLRGEFEF